MKKSGTLKTLLKHAHWKSALIYLVFGLVLVGVLVISGDEVARNIDGIEAWVEQLGPWGGVVFVTLYVVITSLLVPNTILSIMAGALFGLTWGSAAAVAGVLLAAILQYLLARQLLRPLINRFVAARPSLVDIRKAVVHDEFKLQALLRLTPFEPAIMSYMFGAVGVRFGGYVLACMCLIPGTLVSVYLGYAGKYAADVAGRKPVGVLPHDVAVFGGLALTVVVIWFVARMAQKAVMQAVAESKTRPE